MVRAFFGSRKWFLWAYGGGLFFLLSLWTQVHMAVLINDWQRGFFDIFQNLSAHTLAELYAGLVRFTKIAVPYVLLISLTNYITSLYAFRWREAITFDYLPRWRNVKQDIEGSSQRLQEDAKDFAAIVESLGLQLVTAIMTLISFTPILWTLSKGINIAGIKGSSGSLLWMALITSIGGTAISWIVGIKLPGLDYKNQAVEAAFRKELVFAEEGKEHYASIPKVTELFSGIRYNYHRLFLNNGYYDMWSNLFGQVMVVLPFIVMGPALFGGAITFGILIQANDAFSQVLNSFTIVISNWPTMAKLRSIWKRLHEFEANISKQA